MAAAAVAVFLVSGALAALAVELRGKTYRSTTVLGIDQPAVLFSPATPGPVLKLQTLREQYASLLSTKVLLEPIALRVGRDPEDVEPDLQATASKNSLLIVISANGDDAGATRRLAETAADELVLYASRSQADASVPTRQRVVLSVLSPARPSQVIAGGTRTVVTTAGFAGLMAAAAVLVLAAWVRTPER